MLHSKLWRERGGSCAGCCTLSYGGRGEGLELDAALPVSKLQREYGSNSQQYEVRGEGMAP